ncbi:MAG: hypothetical protein A2987_02485 [Omnitrophica bacterium RIFCSPLOWO2_01_FULL_45_10]|nr:MAG: hypothetical protein A2987_02485 [Omnitrophica bacterium RIFCSPLOWO2_01_FULL_45_10]
MLILRIFFIFLITTASLLGQSALSFSREILLYDFEKDPQGWEIPDWAFTKKDHVGKQIGVSEFQASEGRYALEIDSEFTGGTSWEGSYVERVIDVTDWSPFNYLSLDIFLPKDAPRGLRARIILTVGEDWKWTEMNKTITLAPGEWTLIKADLTSNSMTWRRFIDDSFRKDIKKLGVRIESNGKIKYNGPAYIDNVKLTD